MLLQAQQSKDYEDLTRQQIMTYLTNHGIAVSETHIPWDEDWRAVVLEEESSNMGGDPLPEGGLPENCEVETARSAVTLRMELAVGLSDLGVSSATIQSIETGYRYAGEGDRGVLTPMWKLETSGQSYYLNCATGEVTLPTE